VAALAAAYVIAVVATPAGISGAVLLLPFQVSVLGTPSPAVTPTNLLYNVVATPGALYRYWRQGQTGGRLALVLIPGTLPGVVAGSVIRVMLLPGPHVFDLIVAAVLLPVGLWLALTRPARAGAADRPVRIIPPPVLILLSAVVGCVGGIYGIGGGSIPAPVLIGTGRPPAEVAPAALASTFVTSVAGVITFTILSAHHHGSVAPDWPTGIALGVGGLAGCLHRRPHPVPAPGRADPAPGRHPRRRDRSPLPMGGPGMTCGSAKVTSRIMRYGTTPRSSGALGRRILPGRAQPQLVPATS
jgi:uncharacterized membrane protein YfcA